MKQLLIFAGLLSLTSCLTSTAEAQVRRNIRPPIAKYQPFTSPSLYMLGPGGPEFGYFMGTQPAEQFRTSNYNANRDLADFERGVNRNFQNLENSDLTGITRTINTTGHPTYFMNYGTYFPTRR